jgi:hypothetical protein
VYLDDERIIEEINVFVVENFFDDFLNDYEMLIEHEFL